MQNRTSSMLFTVGLFAALALASSPVLAKQSLPPQITQAVKSWQQCAAAAYRAEKQLRASKSEAAEASFASCQPQYDTIVARAGENGLKADDVRRALDKSKLALQRQMTAN